MTISPLEEPPDDLEVLDVLLRHGCASLRVICEACWPQRGWPPGPEHDGLPDPNDLTRVGWIWQSLGRLMARGSVQVAGEDPHEVDSLAAVTFSLVGPRRGFDA